MELQNKLHCIMCVYILILWHEVHLHLGEHTKYSGQVWKGLSLLLSINLTITLTLTVIFYNSDWQGKVLSRFYSLISPADKWNIWGNCAVDDKSMSFGTLLDHAQGMIFSYRAITYLSYGHHQLLFYMNQVPRWSRIWATGKITTGGGHLKMATLRLMAIGQICDGPIAKNHP